MMDAMEKILRDGYESWKENLVLGLPFFLKAALDLFIFIGGAFMMLVGVGVMAYLEMGYASIAAISLLGGLVLFLLVLLVDAYLGAAAVGMAGKAVRGEKAGFGDLLFFGGKKVKDLFLAKLIVSGGYLGLFLLFSGLFAAGILAGLLNLSLFFVGSGLVVFIAANLVLYFILSPLEYVVVLSDLPAVEGLKESYAFFRKNLPAVLLLIFGIGGVSWIIGSVLGVLTSVIGLVPILGGLLNMFIYMTYALLFIVVLEPIFACWWAKLYVERGVIRYVQEDPPKDSGNEIQEQIYL